MEIRPMSRARRRPRLVATLAAVTLAGTVATTALTTPAAAKQPLADQIAAAVQQLAALNARVDGAVERYDQAMIALGTARTEAHTAQVQVAGSARHVALLRKQLGAIAATAYMTGGSPAALQLITATSPNDYLQAAAALDQVTRQQDDTLRSMRDANVQLATQQVAASQAVSTATRIASELAAQKTAIQHDVARQQALISKLRSEQRRLEAIAAAKAAAARAARLRAQRAAALAAADQAAREAAAARAQTASVLPDQSQSYPTYSGPASSRAQVAVKWAYAELGKPYQWGGAGPDSFDCSGLTMWAWGHAGVSLPHSAADQYYSGPHVLFANLQPGDLVFFAYNTADPSTIHHVGIYVGNGNMIDAPHTGAYVRMEPAYRSDYAGATRPG